MEIVGHFVLEARGWIKLPLGELLLEPIAGDLAQSLRKLNTTHRTGKKERITGMRNAKRIRNDYFINELDSQSNSISKRTLRGAVEVLVMACFFNTMERDKRERKRESKIELDILRATSVS